MDEAEVRQPGSPPVDDDDRDDGEDSEENEVSDESEESADEKDAVSISRCPRVERLRPRHAHCMNCHEEFDVTQNTRKSCFYHPGNYVPLY